ncbi:MAG: hypothetical protein ACI9R3_000921 [Verrucomicrobiales bacterium]|jgi:hypothetical protein
MDQFNGTDHSVKNAPSTLILRLFLRPIPLEPDSNESVLPDFRVDRWFHRPGS